MLVKPFVLSMTVFVFYLIAIFSNRIRLSFNETKESDQERRAMAANKVKEE
jgi:hypothetical protein